MSLLGSILHFGLWWSEDDRGRPMRMYDEFDYWLLGGRREFDLGRIRVDAGRVAAYRQTVRKAGWTHWALPLLFLAVPIAQFMGGNAGWLVLSCMGSGVVVLVYQLASFLWGTGPSVEEFRHAMIVARRCPACAYSLEHVAPDESDGCAVCAECGAAWRLRNATGET